MRAGLVDAEGAVLDSRRVATPAGEHALEDAIVAVVTELVTEHRAVAAVGLAVAGFVSADRRRVWFAPHLAWRDVAVAERIERRLGLPVLLEHDANAAALAEHRYGAAQGGVVVLVVLGTGIGGALLVDGELFRGAHGVAPELGHLRLVPQGRPCPCGKRGCWERYCSGTGLVTTVLELATAQDRAPGGGDVGERSFLARQAAQDPRQLSGHRVAVAARQGDPLARAAMAELARWLGEGLALVADVYDPDVVVLAGALAAAAPLFLEPARQHYAAVLTGAGHRPLAGIRTARLGGQAGVIGAALLARSVT